MNPFEYSKATSPTQALDLIRQGAQAKYIGGGTNLVDLMREAVEKPDRLVDLNALKDLKTITRTPNGSLHIGALVSNANTAYNKDVLKTHALLSEAILAGASPQLRNMATCGGNLLQRTRCYYFYDKATKCNKREPGSGCDAIQGYNRIHAVLGQSESCIAVHPSDMCVALAALNATVKVQSAKGERTIEFRDFHRLPGTTPEKDANLEPGELITGLDLRVNAFQKTHAYLKIRDRASYAFALISVAAGLEIESGKIKSCGVAMGGVAHKPWRNEALEASHLIGKPATQETFTAFAEAFFKDAKAYEHNAFKPELGRRALVRALTEATEKTATGPGPVPPKGSAV